jgi:uncharacterized protein involved in outer membrane biogenesis
MIEIASVACYPQRMKKRLWRWGLCAALICVALCATLVLLKDSLAKSYFQRRLRQEIGLEVIVENLHLGLLSPTMTLHNLKILNTADFGGLPLLDIPEVKLEYARGELLSGTLHLRQLRFELAQIHVVKNKAGKMNVAWAEENDPANEPNSVQRKAGFEFKGIDQLDLTLGKIIYSDLKDPANNQEYDLGVKNEVLTNIKSESDFTDWLMSYLVKRGVDRIGEKSVRAGRPDRAKRSRREKKPAAVIVPGASNATND